MRYEVLFVQAQLDTTQKQIVFSNCTFILDAAGCLYYPEKRILIFSDLHLEKGSFLATLGNPLPLYDTIDTLASIKYCIAKYEPASVVCLGDNLHDIYASRRMREADENHLLSLCQSVSQWHWIIGNHDVHADTEKLFTRFQYSTDLQFPEFILTHDLIETDKAQIIGHFHPKAAISIAGQTIRGKCFLATENLLMMPSFGTYTGGLDVSSEAIRTILKGKSYRCYLMKRNKIWKIR